MCLIPKPHISLPLYKFPWLTVSGSWWEVGERDYGSICGMSQSFLEWVQVMILYISLSLSFHRKQIPRQSKRKIEACVIYETKIYKMKVYNFEGQILFAGEKKLSDLLKSYFKMNLLVYVTYQRHTVT